MSRCIKCGPPSVNIKKCIDGSAVNQAESWRLSIPRYIFWMRASSSLHIGTRQRRCRSCRSRYPPLQWRISRWHRSRCLPSSLHQSPRPRWPHAPHRNPPRFHFNGSSTPSRAGSSRSLRRSPIGSRRWDSVCSRSPYSHLSHRSGQGMQREAFFSRRQTSPTAVTLPSRRAAKAENVTLLQELLATQWPPRWCIWPIHGSFP